MLEIEIGVEKIMSVTWWGRKASRIHNAVMTSGLILLYFHRYFYFVLTDNRKQCIFAFIRDIYRVET